MRIGMFCTSSQATKAAGFLLLLCSAVRGGEPIDEAPPSKPVERTCGPQCVQLILGWYGVPCELQRLVEEIQPEGPSSGASMAALDESLRKSGIATAPMFVGENVGVQWPYPVLLHLTVEGNEPHFAVQLPSRGSEAPLVWLGPGRLQAIPKSTLAASRSGALMLTAPVPIQDPYAAFRCEEVLPLCGLMIVVAFTGVCCLTFLGSKSRRRLSCNVGCD